VGQRAGSPGLCMGGECNAMQCNILVCRELRVKYEQQKEQMSALAARCEEATDMYAPTRPAWMTHPWPDRAGPVCSMLYAHGWLNLAPQAPHEVRGVRCCLPGREGGGAAEKRAGRGHPGPDAGGMCSSG
jgi:hypothetical protein